MALRTRGPGFSPDLSAPPPTRPPSPARFQASCGNTPDMHLHRGGAGGARERGGGGEMVGARKNGDDWCVPAPPAPPWRGAPGPGPPPRDPPPRGPARRTPPQGGACMPSLGLAELAPPRPRWRGGGAGRRALEGCPGPPRPASSTRPPLPGCGAVRGLGPGGGRGVLSRRKESAGGECGEGRNGVPRGASSTSPPAPSPRPRGPRAPFGWPPRQWDARGGGGSSPNPKKKVVAHCALHAREEGKAGPGGSVPRSRRSAYLARALRGAPGAPAGCAGAWARRSGEADPGAGATAARWGRRGSW